MSLIQFACVVLAIKALLKKMFHPVEVVSRYRDQQLQVSEKYLYLFKFVI